VNPEENTEETERPTPSRYEITWKNGHVEYVHADQVMWPNNMARMFGGADTPSRVVFHGYVDGVWTLVLSALEDDIRTIRNCTTEMAIGDES